MICADGDGLPGIGVTICTLIFGGVSGGAEMDASSVLRRLRWNLADGCLDFGEFSMKWRLANA